ncbi:hypothetical protein IW150_002344 [Coemansia sp. RSA 2607]|nr:hypothetical protein IW150_002344 [Coemansia sp. RSA 2607]
MTLTPASTARDVVNLTRTGTDDADTIDCLHLLPCSIKYDGPAKTDTYFLPVPLVETGKSDTYEAAFRGRQLFGLKVTLPPSYVGQVVIETTAQDSTHDSAFESEIAEEPAAVQRELLAVSNFEKLTVWEHDRVPAADDDEFITSLEWIDVAASIHADCSSNDIKNPQ